MEIFFEKVFECVLRRKCPSKMLFLKKNIFHEYWLFGARLIASLHLTFVTVCLLSLQKQ